MCNDHPRLEHLRRPVRDRQHLPWGKRHAAADAIATRLVVEKAFMIQARIEVATFAEQVLILVNGVTQRGIGFAVVIAFTISGRAPPAVINLTIQEGGRFPVVISPHIDVLLHHLMLNLQRPYAVLPIAGQTRQGAKRQLDAKLVMALMVVKLDHINVQPIIVSEAIPDTDFRQQTTDEGQITLAVLHDLLTLGVFACQVEHEVLPF
ncbi:hypothetical protein D3C79_635100 [compost metagenome]